MEAMKAIRAEMNRFQGAKNGKGVLRELIEKKRGDVKNRIAKCEKMMKDFHSLFARFGFACRP